MPNHCENDLLIEVPYDEDQTDEQRTEFLQAFIQRAAIQSPDQAYEFKPGEWEKVSGEKNPRPFEGTLLSYHRFIPVPPEIQAEEYGAHPESIGYKWCCENWDTKWDAYDISLNTHEMRYSMIEYEFQSAWGPPEKVVAEMARQFPHLEFKHTFFERGAEFSGERIYKEGVLDSSRDAEYYGKRGG